MIMSVKHKNIGQIHLQISCPYVSTVDSRYLEVKRTL